MHESITLERLEKAARESMFGTTYPGFCIACGEEADAVEPDAERYTCENCGERKVYGAEILLLLKL